MVVLGTRPEGIKLAPLVRALQASESFEVDVVATGQHREMLDPVLELFGIVPDADLDIMSAGQTLTDITVRTMERLTPKVCGEPPDVLVVQGDTTAAMAGALTGFYHRVPVVHLEAGLRSGDIYSPFPEEVNRRLISQVTTLHLAATQGARENLIAEGVAPWQITVVGNTVIDALQWAVELRHPYGDPSLEALEESSRRVVLVTAHRRESWGSQMRSIGKALAAVARAHPDVVVVFPIHRNPTVREAIVPEVLGCENVWIREPLSYGPFCRLLARADLVLSDSGGLQEEGPALGKPVLCMRDTTERPEAIEAGGVRLVGTNCDRLVDEVGRLLTDDDAYRQMAVPRAVYGDGQSALRCVAALEHLFSLGPRAPEFAGFQAEMAVQ